MSEDNWKLNWEDEMKKPTASNPVKAVVMRFKLAGTYSIINVGEHFAVKAHGFFNDALVNLDAPHLYESLDGGPYFNQALGTKSKAERIYKRLNGVDAYNA